jgi:circadian clock protein KaiB
MTESGVARPAAGATIEDVLSLRLYVAGDGPNSMEARANLASILQAHPEARYELEVVDFLKEPLRAMRDGVIVTPTLVRLAPPPERKLIGTLRETATVIAALGIGEVRHG